MRHGVDGRKLGRKYSQRKALYRGLVIALVMHERIRTTTPKAKEARRLADRLITFAKKGDLAARRHVASILNDKHAVQKLFNELGPRYAERPGGYTRVLKVGGPRRGDNAEMSLLELVKDGDRPKRKRAAKPKKTAAAAKPKPKKKAEVVEEPAAEAAEAAEASAESTEESTEEK
jgi:large subunit ribosomal protein L17